MQNNNPLAKVLVQQLQRALEIKQAIADLEQELDQLLGGEAAAAAPASRLPRKRRMSAAAKARISAAQKARWADRKKPASAGKATPPAKKKRRMSPEGRARIIAGTKARWAKYNANKKAKAAV